MNSPSVSRLEPEALNRVLEALRTLGVAGNEGDRRFDAQDLKVDRDKLEKQLRETGDVVGDLSIQTLVRPNNDVDVLVYDTGRYAALPQAEQAWEQDYQYRWQDRVKRSVKDWLDRLADLRSQFASWIKETPELSPLTLVDLPPAPMLEEQMRRFNVSAGQMPVFELRSGSQRIMRFQPKGLWIIGANGRVDLITKSAAPILVDRSERFTRPSNWQLYDSRSKEQSVPLTIETFTELIYSELQ